MPVKRGREGRRRELSMVTEHCTECLKVQIIVTHPDALNIISALFTFSAKATTNMYMLCSFFRFYSQLIITRREKSLKYLI